MKQSGFEKRKSKREKKQKMAKIRSTIIMALVLMVVLTFFAFTNIMSDKEGVTTGITNSITIPEGATTKDIATILKDNHLIKSAISFRIKSRLDNFDGTYKQGIYDVDTGFSQTQIMRLLQTGIVLDKLKITIPEGYTTKQIAKKAEELGICTAEEFINTCNTEEFDFDFVKNLPDRDFKLEGYLFPDTYYFKEDTTAYDLANKMLERFSKMYTDEYKKAVDNSGFTLDEIVTISSVIEREIKVNEERPRAAGVIYNRLAQNMPLQVDATVLYAMGIVKENVSYADLEFDSPYNTYKVSGLPVGPISNAGETSFKAALYPEDNKYLYYVVEKKGQANHVYCETYDEFLTAKAKYKAS